eukprot:scaffold6210_cov117-Alexandrium_tamarense.AAC.1
MSYAMTTTSKRLVWLVAKRHWSGAMPFTSTLDGRRRTAFGGGREGGCGTTEATDHFRHLLVNPTPHSLAVADGASGCLLATTTTRV